MRKPSRTFLVSIVAFGLAATAAQAQTSISGLGQSWPNATDVSASPNYHVYVFNRSGTRYIQVNDAGGTVRGAIARTPYALVGLPIGVDAARVATPDEPLPAPASTAGEIIYQDPSVKVFAAPQTDGTMSLRAAAGDCTNPIECSGKGP